MVPTRRCGRAARQARVGVERDDVAHASSDSCAAIHRRRKVVSVAPRRKRFSSCSLPRLRSQPIHLPSHSFQTRLR